MLLGTNLARITTFKAPAGVPLLAFLVHVGDRFTELWGVVNFPAPWMMCGESEWKAADWRLAAHDVIAKQLKEAIAAMAMARPPAADVVQGLPMPGHMVGRHGWGLGGKL